MKKENIVYIAKSIDGFIADRNGSLDWLHAVPNPDGVDMGYAALTKRVGAIIMGKTTFEVVDSFGIDWPYTLPVFVASNSLTQVTDKYKGKVEIIKGSPQELVSQLNAKGYNSIYIDGGFTVRQFLSADLIDELIITTMPVLLGGGTLLFGSLPNAMEFKHVKSEVFLDAVVQDTYCRKR